MTIHVDISTTTAPMDIVFSVEQRNESIGNLTCVLGFVILCVCVLLFPKPSPDDLVFFSTRVRSIEVSDSGITTQI